jgi:hypothetical protein
MYIQLTACKQYCLAAGATQGNIAKPQTVSGNYLIDSLSASGNINKKGRHLSQYRA